MTKSIISARALVILVPDGTFVSDQDNKLQEVVTDDRPVVHGDRFYMTKKCLDENPRKPGEPSLVLVVGEKILENKFV